MGELNINLMTYYHHWIQNDTKRLSRDCFSAMFIDIAIKVYFTFIKVDRLIYSALKGNGRKKTHHY